MSIGTYLLTNIVIRVLHDDKNGTDTGLAYNYFYNVFNYIFKHYMYLVHIRYTYPY